MTQYYRLPDGTIRAVPDQPSVASTLGNTAVKVGVHQGINAGANAGINALGGLPGGASMGSITAGAYTGYLQGQGVYDAAQGKPMSWPSKIALALPTFGVSLFADEIPGFTHKDTKQYEGERWKSLFDSGISGIDAAAALNHPQGDTSIYSSGPHAGQKWDFNTALEDAKTNGAFGSALGNFQTMGNDWSKYTPQQQMDISKAAAQQGLYKGDHGDILVTDPTRFKDIASQVIGGTYQNPTPQVSTTPTVNQNAVNAVFKSLMAPKV